MALIVTVFLVPLRDNDGNPFQPSAWRELRRRLADFGGHTERRGATGVWRDAGRTYRDSNVTFEVALESWGQVPDWLSLVEWVRVSFRQEAIYITVAGVAEIWTGGEG